MYLLNRAGGHRAQEKLWEYVTLIAAAEVLGAQRVFSIDSDFYVYRLADGTALGVVPEPAKKAK